MLLQHGPSRCSVHPALGGSLGGWSINGQDMLHRATEADVASRDPLRMSSFPLVPYSNRVGNARFKYADQSYELKPNFAPEPHAIHGTGWQNVWHVIEQDDCSVLLRYQHRAGADWPWGFIAEQHICLDAECLTLNLRVRNDEDAPVPLAIGHHPYFDLAGAVLGFSAETIWMNGGDALPNERLSPCGTFDFSTAKPVAGNDIDHCYAGWTGVAHIAWDGRPYQLKIHTTPNLRAAVVYIPAGGDAFCFEPVPHINNALNLPDESPAMPIVSSGAWFEAKIVLAAALRD